jgi:hypothetical protein
MKEMENAPAENKTPYESHPKAKVEKAPPVP